MSIFLPLLLGYLALAVQATFTPFIEIGGIRPDLPVIITVVMAATRGSVTGIMVGFFVGLGQDFTDPSFLGLNALANSILGAAIGHWRDRFDADQLSIYAAILFGAMILHDLVYLTIHSRLALSEILLPLAVRTIPTAAYTAFVGMWFFMFFVSRTSRRGGRYGRSRLTS